MDDCERRGLSLSVRCAEEDAVVVVEDMEFEAF